MNKMKQFLLRWMLREVAVGYSIKGDPVWFIDVQSVDFDYLTDLNIGTIIPVRVYAGRTVKDAVVCYSLENS